MSGLSKELTLIIVGVIFGALATGIVTWKLSHDEKEAELRNIAQALYTDVSTIEDSLNADMRGFNQSELSDQNSYKFTTNQYYNNGLYSVFSKDIMRFDSNISADLYDFYSIVIDNENKRQVISDVVYKYDHEENITEYDILLIHKFSEFLYEDKIPVSIVLAEKIKKELAETYDARRASSVKTVFAHQPETFYLRGGQMHVSTI